MPRLRGAEAGQARQAGGGRQVSGRSVERGGMTLRRVRRAVCASAARHQRSGCCVSSVSRAASAWASRQNCASLARRRSTWLCWWRYLMLSAGRCPGGACGAIGSVTGGSPHRLAARRKLCLTCRWRATPLACTRGALPALLLGAACSRALCLPSRPGAFEVTTEDGRPVFSRLDARYYPARTELVDRVRRALPRKTAGVGGVA